MSELPAPGIRSLLRRSKHFCLMPWSHLHVWPEGRVLPCCAADPFSPVAHYEGSLLKAWNSEKMRQLRLSMIRDEPSKPCERCYKLEKLGLGSLRTYSLRSFGKYIEEDISGTREDGSVEKVKMRHLDIRFSNICNLKCRTCSPNLSSAWARDFEALCGRSLPSAALRLEAGFLEELRRHLLETETAFFAGGEPIVSDELYQVLDHWLQAGRTDIAINYNTNFTTLSHKGKDILEYWKKFPRTTVSASLDASGRRAEYLRSGTRWENIEANRLRMMERCPEVPFEITPTISLYNIWHFPDFHREWIEKGLVGPDNLRMNILTDPSYLSAAQIPRENRKALISKWQAQLDSMRGLLEENGGFEQGYGSVIRFLESAPDSGIDHFWAFSDKLDSIRNETWRDVFPELESLRRKRGGFCSARGSKQLPGGSEA